MITKITISAILIAFSSWLAGKKPELAGFIVALPLVTLLVLPFSYAEYQDPAASVRFARSIFAAIPLSLVFFVPFLLADRLQWSFWMLYVSGLGLLIGAWLIHRLVMGWL